MHSNADMTSPPSAPNAFDGIYQAPILGAPELTIPSMLPLQCQTTILTLQVGEMDYDSRVSGRKEYLPIAVSIMSRPGMLKDKDRRVLIC